MNLEEEKKTEGRNNVFRQRFERSLQKKIQKEERNRHDELENPQNESKINRNIYVGNIELGARKKQTLEMEAIVKKGGLREEEKEVE